jgi:hypothetical protein
MGFLSILSIGLIVHKKLYGIALKERSVRKLSINYVFQC